MTPDELSDDIDKIIRDVKSSFDKQLSKTNQELFDQVQILLNRLELNTDGTIKQNQYNRALLSKIDYHLNKGLNQSGYYAGLSKIVAGISKITGAISEYFNSFLESFTSESQYIKSIQKQTIAELETYLANEGLELTLKRPIVNLMNQNINTGASYVDLMNQIREFILGSDKIEPTMIRYSRQITTDSLFNFSRALQEAVSENSGLEFYVWSGGTMDDSRPFCKERAGKYFHKKEIEGWADQSWAGRRKGTNSSTIFIYAGGYGCLHKPIAVSESTVPKSVIERAKQKGYI
jgi:hypothetical protein